MKIYDVVVVGSGCGMIVVDEALGHGLKVALVDKGPLGGICLNVGCIPSRMFIYAADRVVDVQEARKFGIKVKIEDIDFSGVMERMRKSTRKSQNEISQGIYIHPALPRADSGHASLSQGSLTISQAKHECAILNTSVPNNDRYVLF